MNRSFVLPPVIADLVVARNRLREHYAASGLEFTFDGNLVGDLGEALAQDLFDVRIGARGIAGIDGVAPDGRTVQVKATGKRLGPAFRMVDTRAHHLLFFDLDLDNLSGEVVFNGPEHVALASLPSSWVGQRSLTRAQIRRADAEVQEPDRLVRRR